MKKSREIVLIIFALTLLLALFFALNSYNFLLFHATAETFSIIIAFGMFSVAWNTRAYSHNSHLFLIGTAFAAIAVVDFLHTVAYKGMPVFPEYGANLPTQLWIAARFMEAVTMLAAPLLLRKKIPAAPLLSIAAATAIAATALIFTGLFPECYREGRGLTPFKVISEYIIIALLLLAILLFTRRRREMTPNSYQLIIAALITTIFSELAFTFYIDVYSLSNTVGHYLKIVSYSFLYIAVIRNTLKRPLHQFFINMQKSEKSLRRSLKEKEVLMQELNHRIKNNLLMIDSLIMMKEKSLGGDIKLDDLRSRLATIRTLHQRLYIDNNVTHIALKPFLEKLINEIISLYGRPVQVQQSIEELLVDVKTGVALGLIVNEIITNALKHGFAEGEEAGFGLVFERLEGRMSHRLIISNQGRPFPPDIDLENSGSMGLGLVKNLVQQLKGRLQLTREPHPVFTMDIQLDPE